MDAHAETRFDELERQNGRLKKWLAVVTAWLVITWLWPAAQPRTLELDKLTIGGSAATPRIVLEADQEHASIELSAKNALARSLVAEGAAHNAVFAGERSARIFVHDDLAMFDVGEKRGQTRVALGAFGDGASALKLIGPDGKQTWEVSQASPAPVVSEPPRPDQIPKGIETVDKKGGEKTNPDEPPVDPGIEKAIRILQQEIDRLRTYGRQGPNRGEQRGDGTERPDSTYGCQ